MSNNRQNGVINGWKMEVHLPIFYASAGLNLYDTDAQRRWYPMKHSSRPSSPVCYRKSRECGHGEGPKGRDDDHTTVKYGYFANGDDIFTVVLSIAVEIVYHGRIIHTRSHRGINRHEKESNRTR